MAIIHVSRSGATLGTFEEEKVREGLRTGEFIGTDLGWMEGMVTWRPLSELDDFRSVPATPAQPAAPEPTAAVPEKFAAVPAIIATPAAATGLPWENREQLGWLNALLETVQLVLLRPNEAFAVMRREGGLIDPLLYTLILGMVGAVISFVFSFGLRSFGLGSRNGLGALLGTGVATFGWLIFMPFFLIIGAFLGAGIIHLVLMLVGGAKQPFETTLRVFCFSSGSANVLQVIPLCGGMIAGIYSLALNCIGLARAHETESWRAVVAVVAPIVVCCGGGLALIILMGGLAAAGANWH